MTSRTGRPTARCPLCLCALAALGMALAASPETARADSAADILGTADIKGGLVVHVGCGEGKLTAALRANDSYLVHGLDPDAANVEKAREHVRSLGLCGKVMVERWEGSRLPYVDNLVNLVVAEDLGKAGMAEVMRVLAPNGVAYIKKGKTWEKTVKPRPKEIDEWTHYLYDATNNAVARDTVVGPPRRVQWKAGPTFGRHHDVLASVSAAVSAGGRLFYVIDEAPPSLMSLPPKWRLVARDAFNGVLLWKRQLPTWADYLRSFRSGPPQLPRRLVAAGQRVYATLGLNAPVCRMDAATGETLKTFEATEGTDEILLCDGVLVLVTFDPEAWAAAKAAGLRGVPPAGSARGLMALDADSGRVLWRKSGHETAGLQPTTPAAGAGRVVFQGGQEVRCVELKTGRDVWRQQIDRQQVPSGGAAEPKRRPKRSGFSAASYAPTLVMAPEYNVVLLADGGTLVALDLETGKALWRCPCVPDFNAPADVFVADGLVWAGLFATEGRDPRTGDIKRSLNIQGLLTPGHHPRCYRNKATQRFIISGKRGAEFFSLKTDDHARHNWARGGCQYGILPCNGLLYVPPNACCCYAGAMLHGFYALAGQDGATGEGPKPRADTPPSDPARLVKGPAYGRVPKPASDVRRGDWPTFRGDGVRRGSTPVDVPAPLATAWEAGIGGKLSTPVVAGGKVFVASVHLGGVTAIDAASGKTLWAFTAGGRVDSPPTICGGLALFASADGWVYCLRASDGELVWRFRAAPQDRYTVVDEQLESVWPAHGNVLVHDGVAYVAAGRSCYLDGGIRLYGLDPATGRTVCETRVVIPHEEDEARAFIMAGVRPDVLVTDGKYVYLQQLKFDGELRRQPDLGRHLLAHSGLTDDSWFYRTFWRLGYGDAYDFPNSYIKHDLRVPFGQLLVFNDQAVCGVQTFFLPGIVPKAAVDSSKGCMLFGDPTTPLKPDGKTDPDRDYPPATKRPKTPAEHKWTARLPFQARAMVLAGGRLFVAGWPDGIEPDDPYAAFEGRKGGTLWIFSAGTGEKLAEQKLRAPPVFDGLIAAGGRLFLSTRDGRVLCMGKGE